MGLSERRKAEEFKSSIFENYKKKISIVAGKEIEIDVNWEDLSVDGFAENYASAWSKIYFEPIVKSLQSICVDDMGKKAVESSLNKILVQNKNDNSSSSSWAYFKDHTLTLNHKPDTNIDDVEERAKSIQKLLEENF